MSTSEPLVVVVKPFGDSAVMVTIPSDDPRRRRAGIVDFRDRLLGRRPYGVSDVVSGLESLLVEFDPLETSPGHVEYAAQLLAQLPFEGTSGPGRDAHHFEIPVVFDEDAGPDLAGVAEELGTDVAAVIEGICSSTLAISLLAAAMAPMMDGLELARPVRRRAEPRTDVAPGSIMLAGTNAIIQPFRGPTGWRVVGRTPRTIVDITRSQPVSFATGDSVRFVPITAAEAVALDGSFLLPDGADR
jgi:KipI family sensor histidine kinase inhibitor